MVVSPEIEPPPRDSADLHAHNLRIIQRSRALIAETERLIAKTKHYLAKNYEMIRRQQAIIDDPNDKKDR